MWYLVKWLAIIAVYSAVCRARSPISSDYEAYEGLLKRFSRLKLEGGKDGAVWHYKGVIRNPVSGNEVAGIEGIERCKSVPENFASDGKIGASSFSFLSSKVFAYVDLEGKLEPLRKFKVQPTAPARAVNPLVEMNSLVTMGYRRKKLPMQTKKGSSSGKAAPYDFFSVVQWPSGRTLHTTKMKLAHGEVESQNALRGRAPRLPLKMGSGVDVVHYLNGVSSTKKFTRSTRHYGDTASSLPVEGVEEEGDAPPRRRGRGLARLGRWVSFSGSGNQPWYGKSQEYYSLTPGRKGKGLSILRVGQSSPLAVMHYQRFGEGPEWYAVGKPCSTELTAYKYKSMKDLPSESVSLFKKLSPAFFGEGDDQGISLGPGLREGLRGVAADLKREEALRSNVRSAAKYMAYRTSASTTAVAKAEKDLLQDISDHKRGRGGRARGGIAPWGSLDAFKASRDLLSDRRFVPWWRKLPLVGKRKCILF